MNHLSKEMRPTFFEQLGVADIERIHSQMLAWIFSENFEGFAEYKKTQIALINQIFKLNITTIDSSAAEINKMDIVISCGQELIIIENKIKTSQHSDQLNRYITESKLLFPEKDIRYFFLTLCDESPTNSTWSNVSYEAVLKALDNLKESGHIKNDFHGLILMDYMETVRKFCDVVTDFLANSSKYDSVFLEGSTTKATKLKLSYSEDSNQNFIRKNQLETILQKLYLHKVRSFLADPHEYYIVETRGNAILGRHIRRSIPLNGFEFHLGMDFQNGSFKTMLISDKYETSSADHFSEMIRTVYTNFKNYPDNLGYIRHNKPRSRAQVSFTKQAFKGKYWWHMSPHIFAQEFQKEVDNATKLINNYFLPSLLAQ